MIGPVWDSNELRGAEGGVKRAWMHGPHGCFLLVVVGDRED